MFSDINKVVLMKISKNLIPDYSQFFELEIGSNMNIRFLLQII